MNFDITSLNQKGAVLNSFQNVIQLIFIGHLTQSASA